jgi:hypothetical protein
MVIIMDMTSGKSEVASGAEDRVDPPYAEDVLLAGFTEVPAEWRAQRPAVVPRLAEVSADAGACDPDAYMHSVYAAQGLPGRKR